MEHWVINSCMGVCWCARVTVIEDAQSEANWFDIGFDGAVHMSEEVRRAKQAVPRSIFYTVVTNGILAYAMVVCMLFTMGSMEEAQKSGFPIIEICRQATGSVKAATAMVSGLLVISLSVNLASIASVSRLTWAWARDGALPQWFAYVSVICSVLKMAH